MPSPNSWLLVDVMDPRRPTVVAVGARAKSRVALRTFIRESDRDVVLAAVTRAVRSTDPVRVASGSRQVSVDPIKDDESGVVYGVWVQVAHRSAEPTGRPSAWAFHWDLNAGIARRSAIVSESQSWAQLGVDLVRPIPDGLAKLDLGDATASVLARLVSGGTGTVLQEIGIERRPSGLHRKIQFTAHFYGDPAHDTEHSGRFIRGVSVDLGPSNNPEHSDRDAANMGELVAQSLCDPNEYRAIADPDSLRLLYWYGDSPSDIAWQTDHLADGKPVLHPGDRKNARASAQALLTAPLGATQALSLRLLTNADEYASVPVTARAIDLADDSRAILWILRPQTA
ncbi:DUF5593 domain-containing protein [Rhodococcus sp. IEGM 1401]|uniref:GAF domain-containing protein n=1 Tax=unclassified Rhodococcus (in: high G+C Gram-positive bacteria) TaxID=192944 RepID=UPI001FB1F202|nr:MULTISPECIES: GAF domain-containing protein [unclassified Rhodococcus (in: high G+C Gram-positive bacteria)]MCJ0894380.1 DUF5593 domain-containing protein [Rhodococcus sp. ARC_M5]MCJ0980589.1 DUF5593 domain-containing protein [Rhodococcus sp. ARC_M12]MCZ4561872.1 DUF5593 domain-containing protein [Rhodococcus sp. IEGM 1401]MDI9921951.1 DUF5593 domain-containing protein [Rhodococcus sp. IEGM 1372]MDV8034467.1 DUF5593 domain-containing protein [Rhodococcus sp. IEGM 1414]